MHSDIVIVNFRTEDIPRVSNTDKIEADRLFRGFHRIIVHHGFMETHNKIENIIALAREKGVEIESETASFFLGREKLILGSRPKMSKWRTNLFIFLSRNSMDAGSFFEIPSNQVIEVGVQFVL